MKVILTIFVALISFAIAADTNTTVNSNSTASTPAVATLE